MGRWIRRARRWGHASARRMACARALDRPGQAHRCWRATTRWRSSSITGRCCASSCGHEAAPGARSGAPLRKARALGCGNPRTEMTRALWASSCIYMPWLCNTEKQRSKGSTGARLACSPAAAQLDGLQALAGTLDADRAIADEPPLQVKEGEVARPGHHAALDEATLALARDGRTTLAALETKRAPAHRHRIAQGPLQQGLNSATSSR